MNSLLCICFFCCISLILRMMFTNIQLIMFPQQRVQQLFVCTAITQ